MQDAGTQMSNQYRDPNSPVQIGTAEKEYTQSGIERGEGPPKKISYQEMYFE